MSAVAVDFSTNFAAIMKRLQPDYALQKLFEQEFAILNIIKKKPGFKGSQMDVPLEYDHASVSRAYASADGTDANNYPGSSLKYSITRKRLYGVGYIDSETAAASEGDMGAWLEAVKNEQRNVLYAMRKRTALGMYRASGGALGQIATSGIANGDGTNDRLTLTSKQDVFNFSRGMPCQFDSANGGGTVHGGTAYVRKIDFTNGYVFFGDSDLAAVNLETVTSNDIADADYIFAHGDYGASITGLESWVPLTAPSAGESFLGIDRSVEPERLAGHRLNDTSLTREEIVQDLAMRCSYTGASAGNQVCLMSPAQLKQFALELDTKVVRDPGGKGRVGFRGITVDTANGSVDVIADPACPDNRTWLLDPGTFTFHHLKDFVHLVMDDGLSLRVVYNADRTQFRYRHWGQLGCVNPGKNAVAALPAAL